MSEIQQRAKVSYYTSLLDVIWPRKQTTAMIDDQPRDCLPITDNIVPQRAPVHVEMLDVMLAVEDQQEQATTELDAFFDNESDIDIDVREEGDPDTDNDVPMLEGIDDDNIMTVLAESTGTTTTKWGPFSFREVATMKANGGLELKMVVRCPWHRDIGDAAGTNCSKALVFQDTPMAKANAALRLRQWCLAGRHCRHRAQPGDKTDSHRFIEPRKLTCQPALDQDNALHTALNEVEWLVPTTRHLRNAMASAAS